MHSEANGISNITPPREHAILRNGLQPELQPCQDHREARHVESHFSPNISCRYECSSGHSDRCTAFVCCSVECPSSWKHESSNWIFNAWLSSLELEQGA